MMLTHSSLHYAAADADAAAACRRLRAALVAATASPVKAQALNDLVVTCFDGITFALARCWHRGAAPERWWEVHFTEAAQAVSEHIDMRCVSDSLQRGVAFSLDALRLAKLQDLELRRVGDGWVIASGGTVATRIVPVVFENEDGSHSERVTRSLEGLRVYGESGRVTQRLADIPGLQAITDQDSSRHREPCGAALVNNSRSLAKVLRLNLVELMGLEITQGQSQECLAAMLGFSSWNEMVARESGCRGVFYPVTVEASDDDGRALWHRHYRNQGAALWAYGQALKQDRRGLTPAYFGQSIFSKTVHAWAGIPKPGELLMSSLLGCGSWYGTDELGDAQMGEAAQWLTALGAEAMCGSADDSEVQHG